MTDKKEKDLLKELYSYAGKTLTAPRPRIIDPCEKSYGKDLHERFVMNQMSDREIADYKDHLSTCPACQTALIDAHENQTLFERAKRIMNRAPAPQSHFIEVVIRFVKGVVEVVKASGKLIAPSEQMGFVLGHAATPKPTTIRWDFPDTLVTVECSFHTQGDPARTSMNFTVTIGEDRDAVEGARVLLRGAGIRIDQQTDAQGETIVDLPVPAVLDLSLEIPAQDNLSGKISLAQG